MLKAFKDSEGNIVGVVNCFQDVTERKLAEDAALRLAAIVESSDDAIVGWSRTADGQLSLRWTESGGPTIAPPTHHGCGTRIIENIIERLFTAAGVAHASSGMAQRSTSGAMFES
jgi:hypothetical protein